MISIVILTKNSGKVLQNTLQALQSFSEVVVLDNASEDNTLEIAKKFPNVKVHINKSFDGFGKTRNKGAAIATFDWILSIDSDEVVSNELIDEIKHLQLDATCVYSLPFWNFYRGKQIKCCGWYPEEHVRLYNKKKTSFDEVLVHESVVTQGFKIIKLKHPVLHTSYQCIDDFLNKMQIYSSLFAKENQGKKKSSIGIAIRHGLAAFFRSYVVKKGFLGGKEGMMISLYNANTAFYKYLKLSELNKAHQNDKIKLNK